MALWPVAIPAATQEGTIPLVNPSFEEPLLADGHFAGSGTAASQAAARTPPGWSWTNGVPPAFGGVFDPSDRFLAGTSGDRSIGHMDGHQIAYLGTAPEGAGLQQTVDPATARFQANTAYHLTVAIAKRGDHLPLLAGTLRLLAGDQVLASGTIDTSQPPDTVLDQTLSYRYATKDAPYVGRPLCVQILNGPGNGDLGLDNVRLTTGSAPPRGRPMTPEPMLAELLQRHDPEGCLAAAEGLKAVAERNRIAPDELAAAARLLGHGDPFVRALAEWTIATKVGRDNDDYEVRWPSENPPQWFTAWSRLERGSLVELDWCRQAIALGVHRDGQRMLESVDTMIRRAELLGSGAQASALRDIRRQLAERRAAAPDDLAAQRALWLAARRALRPVVLANPAIDFDRLLLVTHYAEHTNPNITGSQVAWKHKPGGDVCVLEGLSPHSPLRRLVGERLGPGHVDSVDLHWDGRRVVLAYARQTRWPHKTRINRQQAFYFAHEFRATEEPIHLFEMLLDGSGLRRLTDDGYWSDTEPTYCPNGDIVFSSDRCGQGVMCGYATHPQGGASELSNANLYRLSADGRELRRLTNNKDIDRYPHCLDNGLIAYTRLEYQERHFWDVHSIWTVRPDGTMADALFKQHLGEPISLRHARSVPGSDRLVATASGHHTFAYGPVVLIRPQQGFNSPAALQIVTPGSQPQERSPVWRGSRAWENPVPGGGVADAGGFYQTPYALSDTCFLVSYAYAAPHTPSWGGADSNGFAVYLIDVYGNKELVYRDLMLSSVFAIPVRPRPAPPMAPDDTARAQRRATCVLTNVDEGLEGVPPGSVKHLRISEELRRPWAYAWGTMWGPATVGLTRWSSVRVIGTVPVESDGSAHFYVPTAEHASVYFQALDENFLEIRRMRSSVSFQPGEVRSCNGCHETRTSAASIAPRPNMPLAARRPPDLPEPPPWGAAQALDYETLVQPILDRHCVKCHSEKEPRGNVVLTGTRVPGSEDTYLFPANEGLLRSYLTMVGFPQWPAGGGRQRSMVGPSPLVSLSDRFSDGSVTPPLAFGSRRSRLVATLLKGHEDVKLSPPEWLTLVTWIDANAPYHARLINQRPGANQPPRRERYVWPDPWTGLLSQVTNPVRQPAAASLAWAFTDLPPGDVSDTD